ncbi:MAG: DNA repair protein RecO [Acidobacteriota bacterium]|nr:MAG: DNA repair protein RecO [Acidobacteriota bacterium]
MIQTCEAITLRTYAFGEANKIAVFLSRNQGLVRGVAYGAKKSRARFGAALEPMTQVRISVKRKEHEDLAVIQNCEIIRATPAYDLGWEQNLYLGYFAEVLLEFAREQVEDERLYRLILAVLGAIESVPAEVLARYFELWVLQLEGVLPQLTAVLSAPLAEKTGRMLKLPPTELHQVEMSPAELSQLESAAEKLIEYHLEKPLKAKRMLKELL